MLMAVSGPLQKKVSAVSPDVPFRLNIDQINSNDLYHLINSHCGTSRF